MSEERTDLLDLLANDPKSADAQEERDTSIAGDVSELRVQYLRNVIEKQREENKGLRQDRAQRKEYADKIFSLVRVYLIGVFALMALAGFCLIPFRLGDGVLITLLGTMTANVVGLFAFVAKYLFHNKA